MRVPIALAPPGGLAVHTHAIGRTVRGSHGQALADATNLAAFGHMGGRVSIAAPCAASVSGQVNAVAWRPNNHCRFARVSVLCNVPLTGSTGTVALTLALSDLAGHSVASSDSRIPAAFNAVTHALAPNRGPYAYRSAAQEIAGWLDLDALRSTLDSSAPWVATWTITTSANAYVDLVQLDEYPRGLVDDSASYGGTVSPGGMQWGLPILDASELDRIAKTDRTAYDTRRTYLTASFPEGTGSGTPRTNATSYGALTDWTEDGTNPARYRIRPRRLAAADATTCQGEAVILYRFSGGTTETADVRITTDAGATASWTSIARTTSWTWSSVKALDLATNGTGGLLDLYVEAKVSAGTTTFCLAAFSLWELPV